MTYIKFDSNSFDELFRPAEAKDIIQGNMVFLVGDENILYKMFIDEVLNPNSMFKAFCADDGCRYGLDELYILKSTDDLHKEINKLKNIIDVIMTTLENYVK